MAGHRTILAALVGLMALLASTPLSKAGAAGSPADHVAADRSTHSVAADFFAIAETLTAFAEGRIDEIDLNGDGTVGSVEFAAAVGSSDVLLAALAGLGGENSPAEQYEQKNDMSASVVVVTTGARPIRGGDYPATSVGVGVGAGPGDVPRTVFVPIDARGPPSA